MKVLWIGVFDDIPWRAEIPMVKGLEKCDVEIMCQHSRPKPGPFVIDKKMLDSVDVVFLQNGRGMKSRAFECVPDDKPFVFFASGAREAFSRPILSGKRKPDYTLVHCLRIGRLCYEMGTKWELFHNAYDSSVYKPLSLDKKYDVAILGSWTPRRQRIASAIRSHFDSLKFKVLPKYTPKEANKVYNESKIALHIHAIDKPYFPSRIFEVLSTSAVMLTEKVNRKEASVLDGTNAYVEWDGMDSLIKEVRQLSLSFQRRMSIVSAASAVAKKHSWDARMKRVYEIMLRLHDSYVTDRWNSAIDEWCSQDLPLCGGQK